MPRTQTLIAFDGSRWEVATSAHTGPPDHAGMAPARSSIWVRRLPPLKGPGRHGCPGHWRRPTTFRAISKLAAWISAADAMDILEECPCVLC
jgi:hypothetical protein